jgi:phosphate transport system permease protein
VEGVVPHLLCAFVTVPFAFALAAFLWLQLPRITTLRWSAYRLWFLLIAVAFGLALAWVLGPVAERALFAGDIMLWLDGQRGTGTGAWMLLLLPLSALCVAAAVIIWVNPWIVRRSTGWPRRWFTALNLAKFLAGTAAALAAALVMSHLLDGAGFDPRGTLVDTYVQRNSLVVGFVMGFAIIPIIYTISEDALSTVPRHLRSASLGAGATPWQTAVRIVIPTAASGLFSALMIGLGRAIGETMIVLMAAGNTPVTDWNIFNGFRTLSANIAVELPEAVRDSTHYRTLYVAALALLVMTFMVNTIAETVRLRFRRRAVQL